jgi:hypothetical protein
MNAHLKLKDLEHRKGAVLLDAKRSYRHGNAVLSVYGFAHMPTPLNQRARFSRVLLERVELPAATPKNEVWDTLEALTRLVVARLGAEQFTLRAKVRR